VTRIPLAQELRWAWRSVRARGARAWFIVGLMAVALAGNTLVFSVVDSLIFHTLPFRDADQLVQIVSKRGGDFILSGPLMEAWRQQRDIFAGVEGYRPESLFLLNGDTAESIEAADITPGLLALLGVAPRWGRALTEADAAVPDDTKVLIAEGLARRRFGRPELALGKRLETTSQSHEVVGVMPAAFAFPRGVPAGTTQMWLPLQTSGSPVDGTSWSWPTWKKKVN